MWPFILLWKLWTWGKPIVFVIDPPRLAFAIWGSKEYVVNKCENKNKSVWKIKVSELVIKYTSIIIVFLDNYFEKQTNVTNVIDIVIQVTTKLKRKRKNKKGIQIRITLFYRPLNGKAPKITSISNYVITTYPGTFRREKQKTGYMSEIDSNISTK